MKNSNKARPELREIPSVDEIIDHFKGSMINAPYTLYIQIIRQTLDTVRQEICQNTLTINIHKYTFSLIEKNLKDKKYSKNYTFLLNVSLLLFYNSHQLN